MKEQFEQLRNSFNSHMQSVNLQLSILYYFQDKQLFGEEIDLVQSLLELIQKYEQVE